MTDATRIVYRAGARLELSEPCCSTTIAAVMRETDALHRRNTMRRNQGLPEDRKARWQAAEHYQEIMALRRCAAQRFADLNGWRYTRRTFRADTLARHGCHNTYSRWGGGGDWPHELFDHPVFFRELARPYRAAAIVGQPYNTDLETARRLAAELGLVVHAPPDITASWWFPGHARFFCFTRSEVSSVCFLPDQQSGGDWS